MIEAFRSYPFLVDAVLAAALSSIICGIVGVYVVTNRIVFLGGGITHASFGGLGLAWYFGLNPVIGAAVFSVAAAIGIELSATRSTTRRDQLIGIWWSLGMAVGVVAVYLTPGYTPNLMSYLFGSILTLEPLDLWLLAILALAVVAFFSLFGKTIQFLSFDPEYMRTHGVPVAAFRLVLMSLVALSIVFSIKIAGIILIISLLTLPQAIAGVFTERFRGMIFLSILFAFLGSMSGLAAAWFFDLPSGAAIILALAAMYAVVRLYACVVGRINKANSRFTLRAY